MALYRSKTVFRALFLGFTSWGHYLVQLRLRGVLWIPRTSLCFLASTICGSLYFCVSKLYIHLCKPSIPSNLIFIGPTFTMALFGAKKCESHCIGSGIGPLIVALCSSISDEYLDPYDAINDDLKRWLQYWACRESRDFETYAFSKPSYNTSRHFGWALLISECLIHVKNMVQVRLE